MHNDIKNDFSTVEACFGKFSFLEKYDYTLIETQIESSELLGDNLLFIFRNNNKNISIEIAFYPKTNSRHEGFIVQIVNMKNSNISVEEYLKHHKICDEECFFSLENYTGGLREKVLAFLAALESIFEKYMLDIILGNKWEDIQFDWQGYR